MTKNRKRVDENDQIYSRAKKKGGNENDEFDKNDEKSQGSTKMTNLFAS